MTGIKISENIHVWGAQNAVLTHPSYSMRIGSDLISRVLTFWSLAVTLRTARFSFKKFYMALALR